MSNKNKRGNSLALCNKILHELDVIKLKGEVCEVEDKLAVKCQASKYLSVVFYINACCWVLLDTSGYVKKEVVKGKYVKAGIAKLYGRIKHHAGEKAKLKASNKRDKAYENSTPQQILAKLKNFEKYYEQGYSASKSARMANVEYKTAKSFLKGELELEVS
ncbi:conserved hypothetical protein [Vibrio phage 277E43-1]|nr:conserved hypothetical protein [Vibrio phage 277E43-1]